MSILFSIVIPTLNEEKYLPQLLGDLQKQRGKNFEIIIVDGQSDDKTHLIAQSFAKKLLITFLTSSQRNVSHQRNTGAKQAQGKYIVFLDADNRINSIFLSKLQKIIEKHNYILMIPTLYPLEGNNTDKIFFKFTNYAVEMSHYLGKPFSSGGSIIIERRVFEHLGGFNEALFICEDHDLIQRARSAGIITKYLKTLKIKMSLRRMQKEGMLKVAQKYFVASMHTIAKGTIENEIFEYKMGGSHYSGNQKKSLPERNIQKIFELFKKQLEDFISAQKN